ncbi:DinB family protein [Saccharibacillus sp. CPCC 101409]|uniref:DinB family protein n=1 Tax=Saccharibacillus sp. CPCC 101409 TaxID=3058041 RepID=UPI002671C35A|nr:DinB family protein [Saccharibacillus sp. CPCC 101409]MDO3412531.1 DinB family protein [Saccharibacillus sp. CPCC 101409]
MTNKEILLKQLQACRNESGWFTSLAASVKGLTQKQADWKSNEEMNSVHEIVRHLNFYNERYLKQFNNEKVSSFEGSNDDTFDIGEGENAIWSAALTTYDDTMAAWIEALEQADDARLEKWTGDLTHLTIHNAYHIGQIVFIRKQQGSWDKKYGVS